MSDIGKHVFFNDFDIIDVGGVIGKSLLSFFFLSSIVQLSYSYLELIIMSFLTRNCQGDGHKLFMHACQFLILAYKPTSLILEERRINGIQASRVNSHQI
jgi:hypothetical protein